MARFVCLGQVDKLTFAESVKGEVKQYYIALHISCCLAIL